MPLWTEQESTTCLRDYDRGVAISEIAKDVGRTPRAVSNYLNRKGLNRHTGRWNDQDLGTCLQDYEDGQSVTLIAAKLGRSKDAIYAMMFAKGLRRNSVHWNNSKSERCLSIWERGASFSVIASELGITRNAVAGYLTRLGKRRRRPLETKPWSHPTTGVVTPRKRRPPTLPVPTQRERIQNSKIKFDPSRPVCSLVDRLPDGCTYALNDKSPFQFCNQVCVKGTSFCAAHCRLVFAGGC